MTTLFLALALLAAPAAADPNCRDDRGVDRCADEQQARQRALYGAPAIEEQASRGEQVRRIFYVDGYGVDLVLVSVVRAPGRDITLEVRTPAGEGGSRPPLTASVPLATWEDMLVASRHFDRALAPRARPGGLPAICLHSWVYTAEASDPPAYGQPEPLVRRAIEDACQDGLVQDFALRLADQALHLLPPCRAIDPDQHRNAATILAMCTRLSGDRIAAAQAMNALHTMGLLNERELTSEMRAGFGHRVRFEIGGEVTEQEWQGAAPFWLQQRQALDGRFFAESFHGERWDRVRVRGHLSRQGEGPPRQAPMEIILGWEPSQSFRVQQIKVGAFEPVR